jgi:signal transduction histidine kinase
MLRSLFARIAESMGVDAYFNYMVTETGEALRLVSCEGIPKEIVGSISHLELGQVVCGTVALRRARMVATGIQESEEPIVQLLKDLGVRAYACYPLLAAGRLLGTLSFASRTRDHFEHDEIELLETISQYVTVAYGRLRLIQQLREQDRCKDEFLATLAHELRNPLAPIRNALQVLRLAKNDAAALDEARTIMERQVQHMVRLVDDLLEVARIGRNKLEPRKEWVEVEAVVKRAVETSRPLIDEARHTLQVSLPPEPVAIHADPVRLAQALSNLLNNAAKYSEPGGRIWLSAEKHKADLLLRVRDTGMGIRSEDLPHIFRMFVQVDRSLEHSQGGLGIGLTLVQRLVEMHGGTVEARSDGPGKGSEFIIRLPALRVASAQGVQEEKGTHRTSEAPMCRRILVADDNHDSAESMAMILKLSGHTVVTAHDGLEAVELAKTFDPDITFLDLGMPKLDGYEAARLIRQQSSSQNLVLVALTGWSQEEDKRRCKEAGFNAHILKPVDFVALEKFVAELSTCSVSENFVDFKA